MSLTGEVLIVDDLSTNRLVLAQHVQSLGHHVSAAGGGREALEMLRSQSFDLVLLDVLMPEMDGYAVLEQIKADPGLQAIPVVMISAVDEMASVVRCIERGAEDYLPKPFNQTLLRARIGACLEKKRLWDALDEKYRQLQELEKLRDSLTGMIVHDLRTPLTSLLTGLQTFDALGDLSADQRELLEIAIRGGNTLLGMINDLLDISKMESGSLTLERAPVSPAALIDQALAQIDSLARAKSLSLARDLAPDLPDLVADEEKLRRTLVNLLGNAVKFTPRGGTITVSAGIEPGGRAVRFAVGDTGEGIPAEAFERIFEKFGQVETRKGGRKMSTGLGLTFCKMVAEAHGGRIWVESTLGQGSAFSFLIPLPGA